MKRPPTESQAALAARQLHFHRARLRWIEDRMQDNEALLFLYLSRLETEAAVLPGGYRIAGGSALDSQNVAVEMLALGNPYEQLELGVGGGETSREVLPRESRPMAAGPGKSEERTPSTAARTAEAPAYTERECARCSGGVVHVGGPTEVRTASCPDCRGAGKVLCFLYPKPKGLRGPWPPEAAAAEGRRNGDAP